MYQAAPLPLRARSGWAATVTSREVILGAVEEPYDRGLERLGILTLVFLQEPHANERIPCFRCLR
jgi:hypothetical protein